MMDHSVAHALPPIPLTSVLAWGNLCTIVLTRVVWFCEGPLFVNLTAFCMVSTFMERAFL